jgi:2-methylcitrate dehydratase
VSRAGADTDAVAIDDCATGKIRPMPTTTSATAITLGRDTNQALGIGRFAIDFMSGRLGGPDRAVLDRTILFFTDSVVCGLSAIALGTNAPTILRDEALETAGRGKRGVPVFGSSAACLPEKAICANCAAVREWDANGTNFGYNPALGHVAGEFGHNDFYPVAIAGAQLAGRSGADALRAMVLIDEIRGRLAEVFSLKTYKIDHVVHGAIASAAAYGALLGATPEQIESAIGMFVAHHVPWRAIRAGKQLSDSKGASAAISTEAAVVAMQRSMRGFLGPRDIFRNPEALWRRFEPTNGDSPFDLVLSHTGSDFAVMGMHFKLGLYEHQSAGALQGLINLLEGHPAILERPEEIESIRIVAYEPAFGIIGDPAKRDPRTRQSADHSMVYIVSAMLGKAIRLAKERGTARLAAKGDEWWKLLMLSPHDYAERAILDESTRRLMAKITFAHGGPEYDARYPDGIPTSIAITTKRSTADSGLVMYPAGHARNTTADLEEILAAKFALLGGMASDDPQPIVDRMNRIGMLSASDLRSLYDFAIANAR